MKVQGSRLQGCKAKHRTWNIELSQKGFTAIEAVIIVVVLAILTVSVVIKNPFGTQDYATIAKDQLIADIQYVQMRTMGIGSQQSIAFTPGSVNYTIPGEQKSLPGTGNLQIQIVSTNFSGSPYNNELKFNSLGEPFVGPIATPISCASLSGGSCTINIGKDSTIYKIITVYPITGKVE